MNDVDRVKLPPVANWQGAGKELAYKRHRVDGDGSPAVLICNGLQLDMNGSLAKGLLFDAVMSNRKAVSFDYHGVGASSKGSEQCISFSSWLEDALNIIDMVCGPEPQVLVGFFTGAWVALHLALRRPDRIKGLVLIAPGVDITDFWWQHLHEDARIKFREKRRVPLPSLYSQGGGSLPLRFFEDAEQYLLLNKPSIPIKQPVRIYQGMKDTIVPPSLPRELMAKLETEDVHYTLIKNGDHFFRVTDQAYAVYQGVQDLLDY